MPESGPALAPLALPEFYDVLPVGLAEISADGVLRRANRALRRLVRHPDAAVAGLNLRDLGWSAPGEEPTAVLESLLADGDADGDADAADHPVDAADHPVDAADHPVDADPHLHDRVRDSRPGLLLTVRRGDGTELFVRAFARRVRTADPAVAYLMVATDVTAEVRAERALVENERRLRLAFDASPDGLAVFFVVHGRDDEPPRIREALLNSRAQALTGHTEEELLGQEIGQVLGRASGEEARGQDAAALAWGETSLTRTPVEVAGTWRLLESSVVRLDEEVVLCSWRDVTELVDAERRLSLAYEETAEMRATLQTALDATSDGFAIYQLEWDDTMTLAGMRVVHANAAGAASLGLEPEAMVGMELHEFFPEVESSGLWERIEGAAVTKEPQRHRVYNLDADGRLLSAWDNTIAPVGEERMAITWRDVSTEERAIRQLARTRDEAMHSATHDALTDLPNRLLLRQHLHQALRACLPAERVGLVFVDLDRFKVINDTFGHAAGDVVLKETAARLGRMVRHGDLAARLAGDEFVLVLTGLAPDWSPDQFFLRAGAQLSEPVWADGVELRPSASLGVVLADPHHEGMDVDELIKRADVEMYRAKGSARRG